MPVALLQCLLLAALVSSGLAAGLRPKFHFTPRFGWTNDPNGLNFVRDPASGKVTNHLYYQANPNSTDAPWSPPWAPAYWGHATSPDLVTWTEVVPSAIRGGSGAILPLPPKMLPKADGVLAIAFGGEASGIDFWRSRDPAQLVWEPPPGCTNAGPPTGKVSCNSSAMSRTRPGRWMLPASVVAGASMGDPTAAWLNQTDGKLYGVFASSEQCSNCTWRNPGKYQALLFRTTTNTDYTKWEFVSVFWKAPPTQSSSHMGFTNCPDAFRLDDGRWVFAYLTHATQYSPTRILSFVGSCDEAWSCEWPASGQGQYDFSSGFIASQSFTDSRGRRVLFGWISGPHGKDFNGGQSIPRVIMASPGGQLRFLPLPELTSLHTNHRSFTAPGSGSSGSLVQGTSNSYHLNVSFDLSAVATRPLQPATTAEVSLQLFTVGGSALGSLSLRLLPPWSKQAQKMLNNTSLVGDRLPSAAELSGAADPSACANACASHQPAGSCGGWTLRSTQQQNSNNCLLYKTGARVLADVGSGCDALGVGGCSSGLLGWQLDVPGVHSPIGVLLPSVAGQQAQAVSLELFVDQQVCEVFLHDGRGQGSAAATFGCSPPSADANGVGVVLAGSEGVKVSGAVSDMRGCILPPAPPP
jgi:sucrose-6-phosphate hydrolase SacC (GH32 family)